MRKPPFLKNILIVILVFGWIFSGWPRVVVFPPEVEKAHAAMPTVQSVTGQIAGAVNQVVVNSVPGGTNQLYVAVGHFWTSAPAVGNNVISSMTGGGMTWGIITGTRGCGDRVTSPRVEMWWAYGSPASFDLTVNLAGTTGDAGAHVAVARINGAANEMPINGEYANTAGDGAACDTTGTDNAAPTIGATVSNSESLILNSVHPRNQSNGVSTPDSDYTQDYEVTNISSGNASTIWLGHRTTSPPIGTETITHALDNVRPWVTSVIEIRAAGGGGATTTIGDGADPGPATLAPGGVATMLDAFTFQTSSGTDAITGVTVSLAAGTSTGIGLLEVTNDAGSTVYGSVSNPGSDTPTIALSPNITATTTSTQYKLRVTPKTHAAMPAPPGASYAVAGTVSNWTGTNTHAGTDTDSATVTIDNLSPGNVTGVGASAGAGQVTVSWTNPTDPDFQKVIIYCRTGTITAIPTEGSDPVVDGAACDATARVKYSGSVSPQTFTGLTNGTAYYFRIFARDSGGNFSATGVEISATPTASPSITSFSDSPDPVDVGSNVTFTLDWSDPDVGEQVKVHFCRSNAITPSGTGGSCPGGTWASSASLTTSDPKSEQYTAQAGDVGTQNYYAFVCDDGSACSGTTGNSGSFAVQSTAPSYSYFGNTYAASPAASNIVTATAGELTITKPGANYDAVGELYSIVLDTGAVNGAGFETISWNGALPAGKVQLQFATSNSSSGPWTFYGNNVSCSPSAYYEPAPGTPMKIGCASDHWNKRYFRYRVRLCSDAGCVSGGANTPTVREIAVTWTR